jgi:imidazolonepropionase-like amidohydrolase
MRCKVLCSFLCSLILWAPGFGQGQKPAPKTYVLKAARLFDGKSNAVVTPGLIVVTSGKITGVGASVKIPDNAQVIDFGDSTLLPGFIDAHTHLTYQYSDDYNQHRLDTLQKTVAERALDASVNARVTLMAGFTTVRDVGSSDYLDVAFAMASETAMFPGRACSSPCTRSERLAVTATTRTDTAKASLGTNQARLTALSMVRIRRAMRCASTTNTAPT